MKRPAFQFYPGDWQHDAALHSCSLSARGLWIEMMCIMHQAEPYGYLLLNGKPIEPPQLARIIGMAAGEIARLLEELEAVGVFSKDEVGIFSRRMVRDKENRAQWAKRQQNHRGSEKSYPQESHADVTHDVTPVSRRSSSSSSYTNKSVTVKGGQPVDNFIENLKARAKKLNLEAKVGESWDQFRLRVEREEKQHRET